MAPRASSGRARANDRLHLRHRRHDHRLDALPRAIVGRVPHAARRADGRRGLFPEDRRTHRRRGDARAVRPALGCRRERVRPREGAHLPRALRAAVPRDRGLQGVRAGGEGGRRAPRVRDGRRSRQHRVRARRSRDGSVLRRRGRRARRGPRQAGAGSLPARCGARRRARRRSASSSRTRRSESKPRAAPGCVPSPSRRPFPPTSWVRPRTSSRERRISRRWTRGRSRRIFSPDPPTGASPDSWTRPPKHPRRRSTRTRSSPSAARSSRRCATRGNAFPNDFRRDALAADLHAQYDAKTNEELEPLGIEVAVAGRMLLKRLMGKASFATIQDMTDRIQLYITADAIGAEGYDAFKHWDLGDLVGATGRVFKTRTGELSLKVTSLRLLAKALRPLPEKFHGLSDQEQRYRQRYVDLITNPASREVFKRRSQIVQAMREFFVGRGYLEVETPMMHSIPGGAAARPFAHAPQRARHGALPAHRAGALSEEARRRRHGEGVRDQPELPQRRHLDAAQPRVHDARVLRGLSGLPVPDGPHRDPDPGGRAESPRHALHHLPGRSDRPLEALRPADDGRGHPQVQSEVMRSTSCRSRSTSRSRWRRSGSRCFPPTASASCS